MLLIAINEHGAATGNPITSQNFRLLHPDVSFPSELTEVDTLPYGYALYQFSDKPDCDRFQVAEQVDPQYIDGIWTQMWSIREMTADEKASKIATEWASVRMHKKYLLEESDWSQLPDVNLTEFQRSEWVEYRQAVRDVTNQPDPFNIDWPVPPS